MEFFRVAFSAVFISNFVLAQFLGLCPFIGVSKKTDSAAGMGFAVIFVMTLASLVTFPVYLLLQLFDMEKFLYIVVFILVIATLVQLVEMIVRKLSPALYETLGIYLPLITTNCAVLGATKLNLAFTDYGFLKGFLLALCNGFFGGVGFLLAMLLMSGIRESLENAPVPASLKGRPIAFLVTCCLALAFLGFSGMI